MHNKGKILSDEREYTCPWFDIHKQKIQYPNGVFRDYFIMKKQIEFVGVVAKTQNKFVVLKQWRPTIMDYLHEFPMGGMDKGETPQQAAQRELFEETGYRSQNWKFLGAYYLAVGFTGSRGHMFFADDCERVAENNGDETEMITVETFSESQLHQAVRDSRFSDGPSIAAWGMYQAVLTS
jgi:ADP-ribose pyrophosphatase